MARIQWLAFILLVSGIANGQTDPLPNSQGSAPWYCYYTHNWYHCGHADERRPRWTDHMQVQPEDVRLEAAIAQQPMKPFTFSEAPIIEEHSATTTGTDFIERRVLRAGGRIDGALRISLAWFNYDDLDLHVFEPNGTEVYFGQRHSLFTGGVLDVDMNVLNPGVYVDQWDGTRVLSHTTRSPVENVLYPSRQKMQRGIYTVKVNDFHARESQNAGFIVEAQFSGKVYSFTYRNEMSECHTVTVASIRYDGYKFEVLPPPASGTESDECVRGGGGLMLWGSTGTGTVTFTNNLIVGQP